MGSDSLSTANYAAVVADLRAKRDEIDRTIAFLEALGGVSKLVAKVEDKVAVAPRPPTNQAAHETPIQQLAMGDASIAVLRAMSRPLTSREIMESLQRRGYDFKNAANPVNNVNSALAHRAKVRGDVARHGTRYWSLVGVKSASTLIEPTSGFAEH